MDRLTRTINTVKEDVDIQVALDKLAAYEDAEDRGALIKIPTEAYYIRKSCVHKGRVVEVTYRTVPYSETVSFEILYKIKYDDGLECNKTLGVDVFNTAAEANLALDGVKIINDCNIELEYKGDKILK